MRAIGDFTSADDISLQSNGGTCVDCITGIPLTVSARTTGSRITASWFRFVMGQAVCWQGCFLLWGAFAFKPPLYI